MREEKLVRLEWRDVGRVLVMEGVFLVLFCVVINVG